MWILIFGPQEWNADDEEWIMATDGYFGPYTETKKIRLCRIRVEANSTLTAGRSPLQFSMEDFPDDCPACRYCALYEHTGDPELIEVYNNGTFFHYGDNVPTSCNATGWPKEQFMPNEAVSVLGRGLAADMDYDLWIVDDAVDEGYVLTGNGTKNGTVTTDGDGNFDATEIWDDVGDGAPNWYDIVTDLNESGNADGVYNATDDFLDDVVGWGFMAPIPELPAIALVSVGLLGLIGAIWRRRYD